MSNLTTETIGTTLKINISTDITSTSAQNIQDQLVKLFQSLQNITAIELIIEKVDFIDSMGLNLLIGIYQQCQKQALSFKISGASPANIQLFTFVRLLDRFGIEATVNS